MASSASSSTILATPKKRSRSLKDEEPWLLFQAKKSGKSKTAIKQDSISQLLQEFNDDHNDDDNDQNDLTQEVDFVETVTEKKASLQVIDTVKYNAARIELLKAEFYAAEDY